MGGVEVERAGCDCRRLLWATSSQSQCGYELRGVVVVVLRARVVMQTPSRGEASKTKKKNSSLAITPP